MKKNVNALEKVLLAGAGLATVAGSVATAVFLSKKKNRAKVKKIAEGLKSKTQEAIKDVKKIASKSSNRK